MFKRSTSRVLITVIALAMFLTGLSAAPAVGAPRAVSPFGINSHMLWGYSNATIDREMDILQASGATWLRIDVGWNNFEPTTKGVYDTSLLAKLDYIVAQADAHGLQLAPTVIAVPAWANGGVSRWNPPTNDADFGDFMKFMAARYAGKITYWELGNEVNETGNWNVPRDASPARYVDFLKAGNAGTKAGNPNAKVITAGLAGADFGYISEMYQAGAKGHFDIIGIHPYGGGSPYTERPDYPGRCYSGMARVKQVMDANGDASKTIWATELGWETGTSTKAYTEAQQSQYTYEAFQRLYAEFPYVTTIFVYGLRNQGTDLNSPIENYGMLRKDFTEKPAFASFRKAFEDFQGAAPALAPVIAPAPAPVVDAAPAPAPAPAPGKATVKSSKRTVRTSSTVTLSGTVTAATTVSASTVSKPGVRVKLQRRVGGRWITVKTITTGANGRFSTRTKTGSAGLRRYRVFFPGDATTLAAASNTVAVRVR